MSVPSGNNDSDSQPEFPYGGDYGSNGVDSAPQSQQDGSIGDGESFWSALFANPAASGPYVQDTSETAGYQSIVNLLGDFSPEVQPVFQNGTATHAVWGTCEGRVGFRTATGFLIEEESIFCALPDTKALRKVVNVTYQGKTLQVPVLDVGPWFEHDTEYVMQGQAPAAETGRIPIGETNPGTMRMARNKAAIDLSNGVVKFFGAPDARTWGIRQVEWSFVQ